MKRGRAWALILVGILAAGCQSGGREEGRREGRRGETIEFPTSLPPVDPILTKGSSERAAPRWEELAVFSGGDSLDTAAFTVVQGALQWRVRWSCEAGNLRIGLVPPPRKPGPLVEAACPKQGDGYSIRTGEQRLSVEAIGPWKATVEQQVDTPINEPLLPGMESGRVLARGSFYNVEKTGKGSIVLYRLPDGRRALRFSEDFQVINDPDLAIWLSEVPGPKTSAEAAGNPHVEIAPLKSTRGPQNYLIPADLPLDRVRSVVLWCVPVPSAYVAAVLE